MMSKTAAVSAMVRVIGPSELLLSLGIAREPKPQAACSDARVVFLACLVVLATVNQDVVRGRFVDGRII
jgi:hypothetical protein